MQILHNYKKIAKYSILSCAIGLSLLCTNSINTFATPYTNPIDTQTTSDDDMSYSNKDDNFITIDNFSTSNSLYISNQNSNNDDEVIVNALKLKKEYLQKLEEELKSLAYVNYKDDVLYIYEEPNIESSKVAKVETKAFCQILEIQKQSTTKNSPIWVKIQFGEDSVGYIQFNNLVCFSDLYSEIYNGDIITDFNFAEITDIDFDELDLSFEKIYEDNLENDFGDIDEYFWIRRDFITKDKSEIQMTNKDIEEQKQELVDYAQQFVGNPYVWGGNSLTNGTDCSGFTRLIYKEFGYSLPRVVEGQGVIGVEVAPTVDDLQIGDLIIYSSNGHNMGHVAIYIGDGKIVHAANSRDGIIISNYQYMSITCCRRIITEQD